MDLPDSIWLLPGMSRTRRRGALARDKAQRTLGHHRYDDDRHARAGSRLSQMAEAPGSPPCGECVRAAASVRIESQALCDRCADRVIAAATGWPELPVPPPPEVIAGPDGVRHVFRYRLFRWPGRVVAIAEEVGRGDGGHRLEVGVDHSEDAICLADRIRAAARFATGRVQLILDEADRWQLDGDEVLGRLEEPENPYEGPRVVIDGSPLTWEQFGDLLSPHAGWTFHLRLGDDAKITGNARSARSLPVDDAAQLLLRREPPRWFVIALDHYPTPSLSARDVGETAGRETAITEEKRPTFRRGRAIDPDPWAPL